MSARLRPALLVLGLVLVAVVVGRGVYEIGLGLHVLGGAGVATAPAEEGESPAGAAVGDRAPADERPRVGDRAPGASPPDAVPAPAQRAVVDRIVDGDTLRVRVDDPGGAIPPTDSERVRLLNIDTPELDHPERGEDCGAVAATALVEDLTPPGSVVWLVPDVEDRDPYDRPLRGVFTDDGTFVNAEVVRAGWAEVVLFEPNDRFHGPLLPLEAEAREAGRGGWSACDGFPP